MGLTLVEIVAIVEVVVQNILAQVDLLVEPSVVPLLLIVRGGL